MKKALACLMVSVFIIGFGSCKTSKAEAEDMYFICFINRVSVDGKREEMPLEVCRYTGGDTYTVAYTFPDTERYVYTVFEDTLYYAPEYEGDEITKVDLKSGAAEVYARLERGGNEAVRQLAADESGVYTVCGGRLYRLNGSEKELISENVAASFHDYRVISLAGGKLFFCEAGEKYTLKCYDTASGETSVIAEDLPSGDPEYSNGYVYLFYPNLYRVNAESGESEFIKLYSGMVVHDGWIYYYDNRFSDKEYEIIRRNFDNNAVESCGTAKIPWLEDAPFELSIEFGKRGFVVFSTDNDENGRNGYAYFEYGKQGVKWLKCENGGGGAV